jgi:hypothetical protein
MFLHAHYDIADLPIELYYYKNRDQMYEGTQTKKENLSALPFTYDAFTYIIPLQPYSFNISFTVLFNPNLSAASLFTNKYHSHVISPYLSLNL